jgi:hypothetical protein
VSDVALDLGQGDRELLTGKADRIAISPGAGGASDAMYVISGVLREIVIKHVADIGYVQAAGGDIGCNEHREVAVVKVAQETESLVLRNIS